MSYISGAGSGSGGGGLIPAPSSLTFYVSNTGSDSNPGTITQPFLTPEHADAVASSYNWGTTGFFPTIIYLDGLAYTATNGSQLLLSPLFPFGNVVGVIHGNLVTPGNVLLTIPFGIAAGGIGSLWRLSGVTVDAQFQAYGAQSSSTLTLGADGPVQMQDSTGGGQCTVCAGDTLGTIEIALGGTVNVLSSPFCMFSAPNYSTAEGHGTIHIATTLDGSIGGSVGWYEAFDFGNINDFNTYTGADANNYPKFQLLDFSNVTSNVFPPGTGQTLGTIDNTSAVNGVLGGNVDHTVASPTTGSTVAIPAGQLGQILTPAGTLAALTITLPPIWNPNNTQTVWVSTTQAISGLTVNTSDGSAVIGAPTALVANSAFSMTYDRGTNAWYPR